MHILVIARADVLTHTHMHTDTHTHTHNTTFDRVARSSFCSEGGVCVKMAV